MRDATEGSIPWFGERPRTDDYGLRPSAYVVLRDDEGRVAAVRAPQGLFLPGGGVDYGEAPREAAIREVAEEAGLVARTGDQLAVADECVLVEPAAGKHVLKRSTFYRASALGTTRATEPDHSLVWLTQDQAERELTYESHRWIVILENQPEDGLVGVPPGARPASRVLVISDDAHLLLFEGARVPDHRWWVAPGGGLRRGESFEEAAARELLEETGFSLDIGECVWTRHHRFEWHGRQHDQYERFFVAERVARRDPRPIKTDGYIVGHRWWSLDEIRASSHQFAPRRLAELLPAILRSEYPTEPFDVGV